VSEKREKREKRLEEGGRRGGWAKEVDGWNF